MLKKNKIKKKVIGVLGGSFDPPHNGHLSISNFCVKKLKLDELIWVITKKNPFKKKSLFNLNKRIDKCKILVKKYSKIKVKYLENKVRSSKTIAIIRYLKKINKDSKIMYIIGSDNLVNFNKWEKWKEITKLVDLVVLSRQGFDNRAKKSIAARFLRNKNLLFVNNKKINISSSNLRQNYLK